MKRLLLGNMAQAKNVLENNDTTIAKLVYAQYRANLALYEIFTIPENEWIKNLQTSTYITLDQAGLALSKYSFAFHSTQAIIDIISFTRGLVGLGLNAALIAILELGNNLYIRESFETYYAYKLRTGEVDAAVNQQAAGAKTMSDGKTIMKLRSPEWLFQIIRKIHADEYPQLAQWLIGHIAGNPNEKATDWLLGVKSYFESIGITLQDYSLKEQDMFFRFISLVGIRPREGKNHDQYESEAKAFFAEFEGFDRALNKQPLSTFIKEKGVGIFGPHYLFNGSFRADGTQDDWGDGSTGDILSFKKINEAYHKLKKEDIGSSIQIHKNWSIMSRKKRVRPQKYYLYYSRNGIEKEFELNEHFIDKFSLKYLGEKFYQNIFRKHGYTIAALFTIYEVIIGNRISQTRK